MRLLWFPAASALFALPAVAAGQEAVAAIDAVLDARPFHRAAWGAYVADAGGRELYTRNPDRLFVPASNLKLVVAAAASVLLPPDYTITTSVYPAGPVRAGVVEGDLVVYGRGDPSFSARCYGGDTAAVGACDSLWTRMDDLAEAIARAGVRHVTGNVVGDGSYFESQLVHRAWEAYDLNWWYAAPVSALAFNDNSVNVTWGPGTRHGASPQVTFEPLLDNFTFENRARTGPPGTRTTIDFFRVPGTMRLWAEGSVPLGRAGKTEYFALPDPNLYFAQALTAALARRGVTVGGHADATTDSAAFAAARARPPLVEVQSRPLAELLFPILNTSQNLFAEMLVKLLGRHFGGAGSWGAGLAVEQAFLLDSVGIDSGAVALADGSGLAAHNLITPRALGQLLTYMRAHPRGEAFRRGLPRAGGPGSLADRFAEGPLAGRVLAKTGYISRTNALSGYVERPEGNLVFVFVVNNHSAGYTTTLHRIDAAVLAATRLSAQ